MLVAMINVPFLTDSLKPPTHYGQNGVFQKKNKQYGIGDILFLTQAFTPGNSAKLCDTLWKFQFQKPRPMEIPHDFFLNTPGN